MDFAMDHVRVALAQASNLIPPVHPIFDYICAQIASTSGNRAYLTCCGASPGGFITLLQIRAQPAMRTESPVLDDISEKNALKSPMDPKNPLSLVRARSQPVDFEAVVTPCGKGLVRRMTNPKERTHADNEEPVSDIYPMPKWPVNHTSAAFEAVAVKKSLVLSPAEIYAECAHHGEEKAKFHWFKLLMLCTIAGCYVGFGFTLCLIVGGNLPENWLHDSPGLTSLIFGAFGFPFGFTTIVVCGAELFTSLCAYMTAAFWEGKVSFTTCMRMWVVSWFGNFAGCVIFVGLMYAAGVYEGKNWFTLYLASKKVHYGWGKVFVRGIFANWLVGLATWMANAAQDLTGKAVAIWLPISAFAAIGFEHCIANQFLIPLAIAYGAPIDAQLFVAYNLIPSTLGNWVGGAVCVSTVYAFIYGLPPKRIFAWIDSKKKA